jgi:hypothetical protein
MLEEINVPAVITYSKEFWNICYCQYNFMDQTKHYVNKHAVDFVKEIILF